MTEFKKTSGWSKGANNLTQNKRVPEDFVYGWCLSRVVI